MYKWIKIERNKKIIDASEATLEEWLYILFKDKTKVFPNNCFPSEELKSDYLEKINIIPDKDVVKLLEILIPSTTRLGRDNDVLRNILKNKKDQYLEIAESSQYWRRNLFMHKDVWQGLTWIIDLLPSHPKLAMNSIEAYVMAHHIHMTDHQYAGAKDCIDIIRAKYYEKPHSAETLLALSPINFEWLIEELYRKLGYKAELTQASYDNGIDIIATKDKVGKKEKLLIQCKRSQNSIGIKILRELYGVVSSYKATKGVVISTSEFSSAALKFEKSHDRIEVIGFRKLNKLLNMNISADWPDKLGSIILNKGYSLRKAAASS